MNERVYQVGELTRRIKDLLEGQVGAVWVEGELSNVRRPSSGHLYFTLKDAAAQLHAVMFRGNQRELRFAPADGQLVRVFGELSVYERQGQYQVVVRRMAQGGQGALQAAFEALKLRLGQEGLFDPARKKPIPLLVQHVGIVTSPTGAAIRDILSVVTRRFPNLHITVAPVRVQGEGAAGEIAAALDLLNARGGFDVLILARGGGSLEDLWCFNEEVVARAIARSRIPVISAVGHETDFTIGDFVADLRVPTPSAAAELVVNRKAAFEQQIADLSRRLGQALRHRLLELRHRLLAAGRSPVFLQPAGLARQQRQRLGEWRLRMRHQLQNRLRETQQLVDELGLRLSARTDTWRRAGLARLDKAAAQLRALSPLAVLDRGYSLTWDERGAIVRAAGNLRLGQRLRTRVAAGEFESEVTGTHG